ncbi:hypothetical protein LCGC14_2705740, partial [marine sediment metagenome]
MTHRVSQKNKLAGFFLIIIMALATLNHTAWGSSRRLTIGDDMPHFSAQTQSGEDFSYSAESKKVLLVAFLTPGQEQSVRGAAEIDKIVTQLALEPNSIDIVVVITNSKEHSFFEAANPKIKPFFKMVPDAEYELWGQFGLIATPTVIIADKSQKVAWARAGFGYDFTEALKSGLGKTLGLAQDDSYSSPGLVKVIKNTSTISKADRHLKMAKMLEEKGRLPSAVKQLESAYVLDPNSTPIALNLGELLCKICKSAEAIKIAEKLKPQARSDKARKALIIGWANRLESN